jgi:alpha-mannosidase
MRSYPDLILVLLLSLISYREATATISQSPAIQVPGYEATVSGATIEYSSPITAARKALLARATDGLSSIIWKTESVPEALRDRPFAFIWLAGLGCNYGDHKFLLFANGKEVVQFTTSPRETWEVIGTGGARLSFQTVMVDRNGDRFGFMRLQLPQGTCAIGEAVELKVTGEAAKSQAWVMTFAFKLVNGIEPVTRQVLLRDSGHVVQPVDFEIINTQSPATALIRVEGQPADTVTARSGVTRHSMKLQPVTKPTPLDIELTMGAITQHITTTITPVRHWTVYLVQHTHTDIGYTRSQTEILAEHLRYIDHALDLCDQTDGLPDDAKFRWTCETSWAVREYLRNRPATQIARLKKRALEGRIELTGMLLNWAEVADENVLAHSLDPVGMIRNAGMPVQTAMQDDVNGFAWCLVDYCSDLGIRYVTSGINVARALKPFNVPTPFWWESPSGKRVLAYRADHYMTGNFQNIHTKEFDLIERELPAYLRQLEMVGYPYDRVNVQYSGYFTDNSPPSTFACDNIRRWNDTYESPKLRSATVHEFLEWIEQAHGGSLPTYRVAWPDWWTDGFGSAMRETAAGRQTQCDLLVNQGLLAMAKMFGAAIPSGINAQVDAVADNLHFYNEHTFGAAESISDPLSDNAQTQWAEKSSYAWQAVMQSRLLRESAMGLLQPFLHTTSDPCIVIFNTLNWSRSGLHTLYIDNQILPGSKEFRILDEADRVIPVQLMQSRPEGNYWALLTSDIPAMGYSTFRIVTGTSSRTLPAAFTPGDTLQNAFYRLVLDRNRGTIASLVDRELGLELLDFQSPYQLGDVIYEKLSDRHPLEELQPGISTRTTLKDVQILPGVDGPIWQSFIVRGIANGFAEAKGISIEIRLFKTVKRIDLLYRGTKIAVNDPEAVYVAFPFSLSEGRLLFEAQGGIVEPGMNQLPGTATDWNTVQNFAALRSNAAQLLFVSGEIPLVQFGGINTGRYKPDARPSTQHIYSWVLNNYWTTNFRSSQEGEMAWTYVLTSGAHADNVTATRFGWGIRLPLVSRVLPESTGRSSGTLSRSAWPFAQSAVLLVSATTAEDGVILHLRETAGTQATLDPVNLPKGWTVSVVDALGKRLGRNAGLTFKPYESKFVKLHRR